MRSALPVLFVLTSTACSTARPVARPRSLGHGGPLQARTAFVTQEVDGEAELRKHRDGLHALVDEVEGLVLSEGDGRVHLRVPEVRLEETLAGLAALAPVTERSLRAPEVSGVVNDLRVRVDSQRALRDRLKALLSRAETVEEILAVERELGRVTESLAVLEARRAAQEAEVAFAEVRLQVEDPPSPGPVGWVFYGLFQGVKWLFVWD